MTETAYSPFYAVLLGTVLGVAALLPFQAVQNVTATKQCQQKAETHRLVALDGFWGESRHCVDRRYL